MNCISFFKITGSEESTRDVNEESQDSNLDPTQGDTGGDVITTIRTEDEANPQTMLGDGDLQNDDCTKSGEELTEENKKGHTDLEVGEGYEGEGQDKKHSVSAQSI